MSGKETRIASISGLRGVVGDGLDPATVVEFAAAYASECEPGPIVVGHDGRGSAAVFAAAVRGRRHGDRPRCAPARARRRRRRSAGSSASPGWRAESRSRRRTIRPQYNGLKFFQRGGMVLGAVQGRALLDRWQRREFGWAQLGRAGPGSAGSTIPIRATWLACSRSSTSRRSAGAGSRSCSTPVTGPAGGWRAGCSRPSGAEALVLGGLPDGRYDHPPEPTEANLRRVRRDRAGRRGGGRLRPGPRRRSAGDRRRDGPLHRRGADAGPGGPSPAGAGEGPGRAQPLDLA